MTFDEFFPEYLAAHRDRRTRIVHVSGLLAGLGIAAAATVRRKPAWLLGALAAGYLPAFATHWIWEKNQPKTFEHPVLSFRADFVMAYQFLTGRLPQSTKGD